jgi:WD40 repeat protein
MKHILLYYFLFLSTQIGAQYVSDSLKLIIPIGHGSVVNGVNVTNDKKYLITCSDDNTAKIWEIRSGKLIRNLQNHRKRIYGLDVDSIHRLILTYSEDTTICVWSLQGLSPHLVLRGHKDNINKAIFNPTKSEIISVSNDKTIIVWDLNSGKIKKKIFAHESDVIDIIINVKENRAATFSRDGIFTIWKMTNWARIYNGKHSNPLSSTVKQSESGTNLYFTQDDSCLVEFNVSENKVHSNFCLRGTTGIFTYSISKNRKFMVAAGFDNFLHVFDLEKKVESYKRQLTAWGMDISINESETKCATAVKDGTIIEIDLLTGKTTLNRKMSNLGIEKIMYLNGRDLLFVADRAGKCWLVESETGRVKQSLHNSSNKINFLEHVSKDSLLCIGTPNEPLRLFDYQKISSQSLLINESVKNGFKADFDLKNNQFLLYGTNQIIGYSYDNKKRKFDINYNSASIYKVGYNRSGSLLYAIGTDKKLIFFDTSTGKQLDTIRISLDYEYVSSVTFSSDDSLIYIGGSEGFLYVYKVYTKECVFSERLAEEFINAIYLDKRNDRIYVVSDYEIFLGKIDGVGIKSIFKSDYILTTAYNENNLYISTYSGFVIVLDPLSGQIRSKLKTEVPVTSFSPILKQNLMAFGYINGLIEFWNIVNYEKVYSLLNLDKSNYLIELPNAPFYMSSKEASKLLHYVTPSLKVVGFEQLDPVYNRPDIVLSKILNYFGNTDPELVAQYQQAWGKRVDRLGLDKGKIGKGEIAVPDAEIADADRLPYENIAGALPIRLIASDRKYPLRRFNVYVNEVPIYGSAGVSIATGHSLKWDTTLTIPLSLGENKIQVSVMNEIGLENFKYPTYVNYRPADTTIVSRTHYIGIGVNEFQDQGHNLTFCVKDVNDLATVLGGQTTRIKLYTDQNVTRENILSLKAYLRDSTTVHDRVIISCSSHGLLDDSLQFYLATHDVDFNKPQLRGLKYEELEGLLDGIPARQKLLLLDACNSGENDKVLALKKDLESMPYGLDSSKLLVTRGLIVQLEEEKISNFKRMNELFVNVRNQTGSVIISAAGGQQSALESVILHGNKIQNGAFTYSVLEYLNSQSGKSEALTVNKLKRYVESRVEEITNGKQKPTSRQETMEVDWRFQ